MSAILSSLNSSGSSPLMTSVSAVRPCFHALARVRAFPCSVLGPVLFLAFALLASTCFSDAVVQSPFLMTYERTDVNCLGRLVNDISEQRGNLSTDYVEGACERRNSRAACHIWLDVS